MIVHSVLSLFISFYKQFIIRNNYMFIRYEKTVTGKLPVVYIEHEDREKIPFMVLQSFKSTLNSYDVFQYLNHYLSTTPKEFNDKLYDLYKEAHELDPQNRPVTMVCCQNDYTKDVTTRAMDVVCINRYYGWYNLAGNLGIAKEAFIEEMGFWKEINKPLILTEYGADSIPGMHSVVPEMFTEEFQVRYLEAMNSVLDMFDFVAGEHPWNFADFATQQGPMRAGGNHKGLFSRERTPKMAAYYIKNRWKSLDKGMEF